MTSQPQEQPIEATAVVCDADEVSARFLARALSRAGLTVHTCGTAAQCETLVDAEHPDLIVLSLLLPDVDGLTLVRRLRMQYAANTAHVSASTGDQTPRIILVSALQAATRASEAGADAFFGKPVPVPQLLSTVRALFAMTPPQKDAP